MDQRSSPGAPMGTGTFAGGRHAGVGKLAAVNGHLRAGNGRPRGTGCRDMTGLEALPTVQFVTVRGRRLAVLNDEDWVAMVEWLETLEDVSLAKEAQRALHSAGNDREAAGWRGAGTT